MRVVAIACCMSAWLVGRVARPGAARRGARVLDAGGRPRRAAAAALHHAGGPLAAAGDARRMSIRASSPCCSPTRTTASSSHHGVDPLALGRAAVAACSPTAASSRAPRRSPCRWRGCLEPRSERSFIAKLRQIVRAIELERTLSKDEILALYFSLAPYGGNLEGIRAASLAYFGKEPRRLTLARVRAAGGAAAVAGSSAGPIVPSPPRARRATACSTGSPRPASCRPTRSSAPSRSRCRRAAGRCRRWRRTRPTRWWRRRPAARIHRLTIDAPLQKSLEDLARERARALGPDALGRHRRGRQRDRRGASRGSPRRTISTSAAPARST